MCGILCLISNIEKSTLLQNLFLDCQNQINRRGPNLHDTQELSCNGYKIQMSASVLWLQGSSIVEQPINTTNSLFSYNGDVFGGSTISEDERLLKGDTTLFLKALESNSNIIETLFNIHGPYAFIFFDKLKSTLHFGRDVFGRRSLLLAVDKENDAFLITSVAVRTNYNISVIELPAIGIFSFNLLQNSWLLNCWPRKNMNFDLNLSSVKDLIKKDITVNFSSSQVNSFTSPEDYDLKIFAKIKNFTVDDGFEYLLNDSVWRNNVIELNKKLENALKVRISMQPKYCKDCILTKSHCNHCRVGILFSGGVDCTILALLADKFVDSDTPIDLLNVAFDKVEHFETPDRLTGLQSLAELRFLRPEREWNFVAINVTKDELDRERDVHIANLIYPLNTILDDSLGCALWFASRGESENYTSPCRVVLVGMGADELFGGYTRHRAAFKNRGWMGLHHVLEEDWSNIAHRNLARDDRVVADHGRQLRTPYLDEQVVEFVQSLRVWEKTYPAGDLAQGFGEKILLRTLAYYLGLRCAASFKKRALQFGSRIADKKENAHEVSPRLAFKL